MKTIMLLLLMLCSSAVYARSHYDGHYYDGHRSGIYFGIGSNDRYYDNHRYYDHRHYKKSRCYTKRCWKKHGHVKCRYYQTSCRYRRY